MPEKSVYYAVCDFCGDESPETLTKEDNIHNYNSWEEYAPLPIGWNDKKINDFYYSCVCLSIACNKQFFRKLLFLYLDQAMGGTLGRN